MKDIVKEAEAVILSLEKNRKNEFALRTNQLRKFLSAVNTVSNKVNVYQAQIVSCKSVANEQRFGFVRTISSRNKIFKS